MRYHHKCKIPKLLDIPNVVRDVYGEKAGLTDVFEWRGAAMRLHKRQTTCRNTHVVNVGDAYFDMVELIHLMIGIVFFFDAF